MVKNRLIILITRIILLSTLSNIAFSNSSDSSSDTEEDFLGAAFDFVVEFFDYTEKLSENSKLRGKTLPPRELRQNVAIKGNSERRNPKNSESISYQSRKKTWRSLRPGDRRNFSQKPKKLIYSSNKAINIDQEYEYSTQINYLSQRIKSLILLDTNNLRDGKLCCIFEQPQQDVQLGTVIFKASEIALLLTEVIDHLSTTMFIKSDLLCEAECLSPHDFHHGLMDLSKIGNKGPFLVSFEKEGILFYPYDQFLIFKSKSSPLGKAGSVSNPKKFYKVLLKSTAYPEAEREYHYWISSYSKEEQFIESGWIDFPKYQAKPDALMVVQSTGNLQNIGSWNWNKRIGPGPDINIKFVFNLYQASLAQK